MRVLRSGRPGSGGSALRNLGGFEQGFASGAVSLPNPGSETAMLGQHAARQGLPRLPAHTCRQSAQPQRGFAARAAARPKKANNSEAAQAASNGNGLDKVCLLAPLHIDGCTARLKVSVFRWAAHTETTDAWMGGVQAKLAEAAMAALNKKYGEHSVRTLSDESVTHT